MKKRRTFTLIETLISLGLFVLLLSFLFFFYGTFYRDRVNYQKMKGPVYERAYMESRMQFLFAHMREPFFLAEDKSLVFLLDRGVWKEPLLSGVVLAKIYHDPLQKTLCLVLYPKPEKQKPLREPSQHICLLDNIEDVSFNFYYPPSALPKVVDPEKIVKKTPKAGWQESWASEYATHPAFVKMTWKKNQKIEVSYFELEMPILYPHQTVIS